MAKAKCADCKKVIAKTDSRIRVIREYRDPIDGSEYPSKSLLFCVNCGEGMLA